MKTFLIKVLTFWIFYSPWRRACRRKLRSSIGDTYHSIFAAISLFCQEDLHHRNIKSYITHKNKRGKAKTVIYTAITGGYDNLKTPQYLQYDVDYVCFTDTPVEGDHVWEIRPMNDFNHGQPVIKAKYYKFFPDKLFPEYTYSVWIDGTWDITGPYLSNMISELTKSGSQIACAPHFERDCIYKEAQICLEQNLDDPWTIERQIDFLHKETYPYGYGLFEMGIIYRKHSAPVIIDLMSQWWNMIMKFSRRDQLSFCYLLWKNNIEADLLFPSQSQTIRFNNNFVYHPHCKNRPSDLPS